MAAFMAAAPATSKARWRRCWPPSRELASTDMPTPQLAHDRDRIHGERGMRLHRCRGLLRSLAADIGSRMRRLSAARFRQPKCFRACPMPPSSPSPRNSTSWSPIKASCAGAATRSAEPLTPRGPMPASTPSTGWRKSFKRSNAITQSCSRTAPSHPLCGRPSVCVSTIHGGVGVNTVPERATIEIDRRLGPDEQPETAYDELVRLHRRACRRRQLPRRARSAVHAKPRP